MLGDLSLTLEKCAFLFSSQELDEKFDTKQSVHPDKQRREGGWVGGLFHILYDSDQK